MMLIYQLVYGERVVQQSWPKMQSMANGHDSKLFYVLD